MKKKNKAKIEAGAVQTDVRDEGTIIREQERLAKAAKRKKRKKWKILVTVCVLAVCVAGTWYLGWGRKRMAAKTAATTVKIEKTVGQSVVYARIDEINGNEITYTIAEEVKTGGTAASDKEGSARPNKGKQNSGQDMPMPDMSQMQGGFGGNRGGMKGGNTTGNSDTGMILYDGSTYRVGTEKITQYIPVGTDVTTKLGTVTTFSRLAAGDYIALVTDKADSEEVIVAVYIIG